MPNCENDDERFRVEKAAINSEEWLTMLKRLSKCKSGLRNSRSTNARDRIEAFIKELLMAGHKIHRRDISRVAGYEDSSELQRFQRNDSRTTETGLQNFNRVLAMSPEDFMRVLSKRRS